jgi:hypothetical protein
MVAEGVGSKWTIGLDDVGYILSTQDQESPFEYRAFTQQAVPLSLPRIDTSPEPGEQSLGDLWVRAQHDWSEGMGQRVFDGQNSSRLAAKEIGGYDPFIVPGQLTPAPAGGNSEMGGMGPGLVIGDLVYMFGPTASGISRFNEDLDEDTETITSRYGASFLYPHNITADGSYIYWATTGSGIRRMLVTDSFGAWSESDALFNDLDACEVIEWAKGRFIACTGPDVHVIEDPTSTTSGATPHFTHLDDTWEWTDVEDMSQGIYLSGFSDARSQLYLMTFNTTDAASGLTIGIPREIWRAPYGEKILCIKGYAGTAFLIGTNKGVRNCQIADREGNVLVGPLIPVHERVEVHEIAVWGKYAYFYYGPAIGAWEGPGKVAKMDLSTFAYAAVLPTSTQQQYKGWAIALIIPPWFKEWQYPVVATTDGVTNIWTTHPRKDGITSYIHPLPGLQVGEITFGTSVEKEFKHIEVELDPSVIALDGSSGGAFTTDPTITTPRDFIFRVALATWTGSPSVLAYQGNSPTAPDYHWRIRLTASRELEFSFLDDSDVVRTATSDALPSGWSENDVVWVHIEYAGQYVTFSYILERNNPFLIPYPDYALDLWTELSQEDLGASYNFKNGTYADLTVWLWSDTPTPSTDLLYSFQIWTAQYWLDPDERAINFTAADFSPDPDGNTWTLFSDLDIVSPVFNIYYNADGKGLKLLTDGFERPSSASLTYFFPENTQAKKMDIIIASAGGNGINPTGHSIRDWRLLCEPIPTPRYYRYYVPIMLYDDLQLLDGHRISRRGYAWEALTALDTIYREGTSVDFQKPSGYLEPSVTTRVRIENLEFKEFAPPKGASGFGGICLLVLREVAT